MGYFKVILISSILCTSISAIAGETDIATALKKPGSLVFLKSEFIPSHLADGTPTYYELVVYDGELHRVGSEYNPDEQVRLNKLSCLGEFSTAILDHQQNLIPTDVDIKPGASFKWNPEPAYSYEVYSGDRYIEKFSLVFYHSDTLVQISCAISHKNPNERLTVSDFEEATGGRMTLK